MLLFVLYGLGLRRKPIYGIFIWHPYNMSCSSYLSSLSEPLDTGFAIKLRQLRVHSSPSYAILAYSDKNGLKHTSFKNSQCSKFLFKYCSCFMPIKDYRFYQRSVLCTLSTRVRFARFYSFVEPVVTTTLGSNASPNISAAVCFCLMSSMTRGTQIRLRHRTHLC